MPTPTLRIVQQPGSGANRHRIAVDAQIPHMQSISFAREIEFALSPQDAEKIRWYLEDYLQFDEDPAPKIAARVEALMAERGEALFREIFDVPGEAVRLWAMIEPHLSSTRIEIVTGIAEASSIPWELLRNPHAGVDLALSAEAFVRSQSGAQSTPASSQSADKVRILLAICRPGAGGDVPFRSVAGRLVKGLSDADREAFQLDVLRPPTYEQLAKALKLAKEKGRPYHIVHFDGHGIYADPKNLESAGHSLSKVMLKGGEAGPRGYLYFEDPDSESRNKLVDGFTLGGLLRDAGVPILILNACQSAFADAKPQPDEDAPQPALEEIEAYGSLAQAVVNAGAAGVVAMRYSVYVVTAAQFVAELYAALARGRTLGQAVAWARGNLAAQPNRTIAYEARPLRDWIVPIVWERTPLRLWPETPEDAPLRIELDGSGTRAGALDARLPKPPEIGFFGRDETLYALDRAFDRHRIVLLHAFAGSGKTTTAAEFARWYAATGGVQGSVLFTSFERHLPLARVLDKIGEHFDADLQRAGIHWGAANDARRRQIALDVLRQVPVLWIWDNVEPVAGFPAGTPSDWSTAEQQELRDFLLEARQTKAKFLLTSRRDERAWLGEMPRRVEAPPVPMQERLQLAGAIVEHRGKRLADLPDLTPLLRFTQGNPLTILVTVGVALRAGIDSKERLDAFVATLRAGEVDFEDEETEGRTKSLGASLSYGFADAFTEGERKRLALLHLFQGFVDVDVLVGMGVSGEDWSLEKLHGLEREQCINLLDKAADLGLLNYLGDGYYIVHPALPWYFRDFFYRSFAGEERERPNHAFVISLGEFANFYAREYSEGKREAISLLMAEEDNLIAAWGLAIRGKYLEGIVNVMQGLRILYGETGRGPAWRRLVKIVSPIFIDMETKEPLAGRDKFREIIIEYLVQGYLQDRNFAEAETLQRLLVNSFRDHINALPAEVEAKASCNDLQYNLRDGLVSCLGNLGDIQREMGNSECVKSYLDAFDLAKEIADREGQAISAHNLGVAYIKVAAIRNFDAAENWLRQSLDLRLPSDGLGRGKSLGSIGGLFLFRMGEAQALGKAEHEVLGFLNEAAKYYHQALQLIPLIAIKDRGVLHNQLGIVYARANNIDLSLYHFQKNISYHERSGNLLLAAESRWNVASILFGDSRFDDARTYAEAALENFTKFGERAEDEIQKTKRLIARIDNTAAEQQAKS